MNLPHFLHLAFWGLGKKHKSYTLFIEPGKLHRLVREDGESETDPDVISDFNRYYSSLPEAPSKGAHQLDYDVPNREFHGFGTRHTKYRVVRNGPSYTIYDGLGNTVEDSSVLHTTLLSLIDSSNMAAEDVPEGGDGMQLDYDDKAGTFRGFEKFGGGDSAGGGASNSWDRVQDSRDASDSASENTDQGSDNSVSNDTSYDSPSTDSSDFGGGGGGE